MRSKRKQKDLEEAHKTLTIETVRQLEVISRYYDVDMDSRIVTINLVNEKASDLFVAGMETKAPIANNSMLEGISNNIHSIPEDFNVEYNIIIKDYEEYEPEEIIHSVRDAFEVFNYDVNVEKRRNKIKMSVLLFLGCFFFAFLFYMCSLNLLKNEIQHNIFHEIIYTVACVLLWEGIYILFLPESSYNSINESILNRISRINLLDSDRKVVASNSLEDIKENWVHYSKHSIRWKRTILFAGTGILIFAGIALADAITFGLNIHKDFAYVLSVLIIDLVFVINSFMCGFSALSYYMGRGKLRLHLRFYTILEMVFVLTLMGLLAGAQIKFGENMSYYFICEIIVFVLLVLVLVGSIVLRSSYINIKNNKSDSKTSKK